MCRCLSAVILSRPEMLAVMYEKACPVLVQRFRERRVKNETK
jgi:cullin-associated NEDD8-dissociated protein 1